MKTVAEIVKMAKAEPGCVVAPPTGLPNVESKLPDDLCEFYRLCGGLDMFPQEDWGWRIVDPNEFMPTLDVTFGRELFEEDRGLYSTGLEDTLYFLAVRGAGPDSVSIDLRPGRFGWCYDPFDGDFLSTYVYIIALSFTELLNGFYSERSEITFWHSHAYGCIGCSPEMLKWRPQYELDQAHFGVAPSSPEE